jgi:hypothetical protein
VASFRDAGALLLVVASAGAPALERIIPLFDGVVLVGDAAAPAGLPVLAHARGDDASAVAEKRSARAPAHRARTPRAPFWVAIAATVLAVVALGWWAVQSSLGPISVATNSVTSAGALIDRNPTGHAPSAEEPAPDSSVGAAEGPNAVAPGAGTPPSTVTDAPVDSNAVVPFGVALAQYNDVTAALTRIAQEAARGIPASTYAPIYDTNLRRQVFLVIAGAFHDRTDATSLLRSLRRQRVVGNNQGHVIDAPFAILVSSGLNAEQAKAQLEAYRLKGMPVYSLVQPGGAMNVYAGAFRTTAEAEFLLKTLSADGATPRIVRRAGRPTQ